MEVVRRGASLGGPPPPPGCGPESSAWWVEEASSSCPCSASDSDECVAVARDDDGVAVEEKVARAAGGEDAEGAGEGTRRGSSPGELLRSDSDEELRVSMSEELLRDTRRGPPPIPRPRGAPRPRAGRDEVIALSAECDVGPAENVGAGEPPSEDEAAESLVRPLSAGEGAGDAVRVLVFGGRMGCCGRARLTGERGLKAVSVAPAATGGLPRGKDDGEDIRV
mmetsp:Transcript_8580/g.26613  ORF Transcript_8580/g.26613 Transcript_8580/m.26613 type:complete len:223 (-) Transcript_8580:229-897(-)